MCFTSDSFQGLRMILKLFVRLFSDETYFYVHVLLLLVCLCFNKLFKFYAMQIIQNMFGFTCF